MIATASRTVRMLLAWSVAMVAVGGCASQESDRLLLRAAHAADASYAAGDYATARRNYVEVLRAQPHHARAAVRLGAIAYREGDLTAAEQYFAGVVARDSRYANAKYNLAVVKLSQAKRLLTDYLQLAPAAPNRERVAGLIAELDTHQER
jgi:tetratricopeptide (TPR) repeat protein